LVRVIAAFLGQSGATHRRAGHAGLCLDRRPFEVGFAGSPRRSGNSAGGRRPHRRMIRGLTADRDGARRTDVPEHTADFGGQLFGLPTATMSVAEEFLEPGDWLTLYTDGITEARDETGNFFGEERLVDSLRREAASERPPPETVRRLVQAVMRHQRGVLQDDATVLLARWDAQLHPEQ
jgi:serine/threonine protein phosphatase PrpC